MRSRLHETLDQAKAVRAYGRHCAIEVRAMGLDLGRGEYDAAEVEAAANRWGLRTHPDRELGLGYGCALVAIGMAMATGLDRMHGTGSREPAMLRVNALRTTGQVKDLCHMPCTGRTVLAILLANAAGNELVAQATLLGTAHIGS